MFSGMTMCVVTSRLMYIFSLADRCTAMPVIRHIIRKILVFIFYYYILMMTLRFILKNCTYLASSEFIR